MGWMGFPESMSQRSCMRSLPSPTILGGVSEWFRRCGASRPGVVYDRLLFDAAADFAECDGVFRRGL
jgi:hypothetical protein